MTTIPTMTELNRIYECFIITVVFWRSFIDSVNASYPTLGDGDTVSISLLNYNVSDPLGQSIEVFYTISPNSAVTISVSDIPGDAVYFLLQAHTFFQDLCLSQSPEPTYNSSVNGTNIGLWSDDISPKFYLHYGDKNNETTVMFAIQAYSHQAPTPGGCNMEFPTKVAPYLQTSTNDSIVTVQFAPASPPHSVLVWLGLLHNHSCAKNLSNYTVYRTYQPERNFDPETYFSTIKNMMTVGRIKEHGHVVPLMGDTPSLKRIFAAYPGTGSAYVVVASYDHHSAVYVPSFSYGCRYVVDENTCGLLITWYERLICALTLSGGLLACFTAHRFFGIENMLVGLFAGGIIIYTLIYNDPARPNDLLVLSVVGGLIFGLVLRCWWCLFPIPLLSIILVSSILGFMISSVVLNAVTDYIDLTWDVNYWILFLTIMLSVCIAAIFLAERANVATTSFVGAYVAIVPIDYYMGSNVRFVLFNVLRRAKVPYFNWAVIDPPYQINDIFLTVLWLILAGIGFATQSYLIRNRPPFPPPSCTPNRWFYRRPSRGWRPVAPNERTALLAAQNTEE